MTPAVRMLFTSGAPFTPATVIPLGNSITIGGQAGVATGVDEYVTKAAAIMRGSFIVHNRAVGGRFIDNPATGTDMLGDLPAAAALVNSAGRFGYGSVVCSVLLLCGSMPVNDLLNGATLAQAITRTEALLTAARATWNGTTGKIVVGGAFAIDEPDRGDYDAALAVMLGNGLFDVFVPTPSELLNRSDGTIYLEAPGGSGIHPTALGHTIYASPVAAGINTAVGLAV